jgi:hypothetical protein
MLAMLLWFSAMLITERPKSITIMRGAWKPRVATRLLSRVYARASRPTGIAKGYHYACYSSEPQRAASIEDQIRLCKERIAREGCECSLVLAKSPATRAGE